MLSRLGNRRRPLAAKRFYGWRDLVAALGVHAILLQVALGVVSGLASGPILGERAQAGATLAALALEICSPAGLIQLADGDDPGQPRRGAPICPGCLFAHAAPPPPQVSAPLLLAPSPAAPVAVDADNRPRAATALITALNPRAPPFSLV